MLNARSNMSSHVVAPVPDRPFGLEIKPGHPQTVRLEEGDVLLITAACLGENIGSPKDRATLKLDFSQKNKDKNSDLSTTKMTICSLVPYYSENVALDLPISQTEFTFSVVAPASTSIHLVGRLVLDADEDMNPEQENMQPSLYQGFMSSQLFDAPGDDDDDDDEDEDYNDEEDEDEDGDNEDDDDDEDEDEDDDDDDDDDDDEDDDEDEDEDDDEDEDNEMRMVDAEDKGENGQAPHTLVQVNTLVARPKSALSEKKESASLEETNVLVQKMKRGRREDDSIEKQVVPISAKKVKTSETAVTTPLSVEKLASSGEVTKTEVVSAFEELVKDSPGMEMSIAELGSRFLDRYKKSFKKLGFNSSLKNFLQHSSNLEIEDSVVKFKVQSAKKNSTKKSKRI